METRTRMFLETLPHHGLMQEADTREMLSAKKSHMQPMLQCTRRASSLYNVHQWQARKQTSEHTCKQVGKQNTEWTLSRGA
mmetsp:Transcript_1560/g.2121  ORF Transcript_1560/g.2121 Transcript_1560/m.2121 type:complete len:81 (-) Transcript_1560:54-296(-)